MPQIRHVHLADKVGRVAPGQSGKSDYAPFFAILKSGGYDGSISVEAPRFTDSPEKFVTVLKYLKHAWAKG